MSEGLNSFKFQGKKLPLLPRCERRNTQIFCLTKDWLLFDLRPWSCSAVYTCPRICLLYWETPSKHSGRSKASSYGITIGQVTRREAAGLSCLSSGQTDSPAAWRTDGPADRRTVDCGLRTADCGLRTADCGLVPFFRRQNVKARKEIHRLKTFRLI